MLGSGDSGRITIAVAAIVGAMRGDVFALRGLCELPHISEADSALSGGWRVIGRKCAAGSGRAGIVDRPVDDLARRGILANVFGGDDVAVIRGGDARAIDAGAESGGRDGVDPCVDVGFLLGQHASTLLLVEEDDRMRGKAFAVRGSGGGLRVSIAELRGAGNGFQFGRFKLRIEASVEE